MINIWFIDKKSKVQDFVHQHIGEVKYDYQGALQDFKSIYFQTLNQFWIDSVTMVRVLFLIAMMKLSDFATAVFLQ